MRLQNLVMYLNKTRWKRLDLWRGYMVVYLNLNLLQDSSHLSGITKPVRICQIKDHEIKEPQEESTMPQEGQEGSEFKSG